MILVWKNLRQAWFRILLFSVSLGMLVSCQSASPTLEALNDDYRGPFQAMGLKDFSRLEHDSRWSLADQARLYIAFPDDDMLDDGFRTDLISAFTRYFPDLQVAARSESFNVAMASAGYSGADLLVYPVLRKRRSKLGLLKLFNKQIRPNQMQNAGLEMDIYLYSVSNRQAVDFLRFTATGSFFSGSELDLLWPPLDAYLRGLAQN